jgi:copper(I)-binding protein
MRIVPILAVTAALALAGCHKQEKQAAANSTASASASTQAPALAEGPDAKPGLRFEGGRLVLPVLKGSPGAAYFMLDNSSGATAVLAAISIDGAGKADMHQTADDKMTSVDRVEIAPGTSITFEPGKLHVMVFDLQDKLRPGGTTQMTLTFADGDKLSAPLKIEAAGSGGDMEQMH